MESLCYSANKGSDNAYDVSISLTDDEWLAEYQEAVAMMTVARQRRAEVNTTVLSGTSVDLKVERSIGGSRNHSNFLQAGQPFNLTRYQSAATSTLIDGQGAFAQALDEGVCITPDQGGLHQQEVGRRVLHGQLCVWVQELCGFVADLLGRVPSEVGPLCIGWPLASQEGLTQFHREDANGEHPENDQLLFQLCW